MSLKQPEISIRNAVKDDGSSLLQFITELADYERMSDDVVATAPDISSALFGPRPCAEAVIAEWETQPVGFALFFQNFSTFEGRPGLYLEDLFVQEKYRGKGLGKALLVHLARLAKERNCARFEWSVLDGNEPSIRFYESLGATPMTDWSIFRLSGEALDTLAA
ncbi:MAG: GNAT family N-acetyltransferase [Proteobacteria bacterium]|nr:GNAT family N-acetyltransferase [Pseudomonadota bacterium]